jgi:hypothetical protein
MDITSAEEKLLTIFVTFTYVHGGWRGDASQESAYDFFGGGMKIKKYLTLI